MPDAWRCAGVGRATWQSERAQAWTVHARSHRGAPASGNPFAASDCTASNDRMIGPHDRVIDWQHSLLGGGADSKSRRIHVTHLRICGATIEGTWAKNCQEGILPGKRAINTVDLYGFSWPHRVCLSSWSLVAHRRSFHQAAVAAAPKGTELTCPLRALNQSLRQRRCPLAWAARHLSGTAFAVRAGYLKISGGEPLHDAAAPRPKSSRLFSILSSDGRQSAGRV